MRNVIVMFVGGLALIVGCHSQVGSPSEAQLVMSEGSASSGGLSVSNGNVIVEAGQPGIAFTSVTKPGSGKRLAYFLVFNHDLADSAGVQTKSGTSGAGAHASHTIKTLGHECRARYEIVLAVDSQSSATEKMTIDQPYDLGQGRVFLIDMSANPPAITQLALELPNHVPVLSEIESTKSYGRDALDSLRKNNETVESFCRQAEAGEGGP